MDAHHEAGATSIGGASARTQSRLAIRGAQRRAEPPNRRRRMPLKWVQRRRRLDGGAALSSSQAAIRSTTCAQFAEAGVTDESGTIDIFIGCARDGLTSVGSAGSPFRVKPERVTCRACYRLAHNASGGGTVAVRRRLTPNGGLDGSPRRWGGLQAHKCSAAVGLWHASVRDRQEAGGGRGGCLCSARAQGAS